MACNENSGHDLADCPSCSIDMRMDWREEELVWSHRSFASLALDGYPSRRPSKTARGRR